MRADPGSGRQEGGPPFFVICDMGVCDVYIYALIAGLGRSDHGGRFVWPVVVMVMSVVIVVMVVMVLGQ